MRTNCSDPSLGVEPEITVFSRVTPGREDPGVYSGSQCQGNTTSCEPGAEAAPTSPAAKRLHQRCTCVVEVLTGNPLRRASASQTRWRWPLDHPSGTCKGP